MKERKKPTKSFIARSIEEIEKEAFKVKYEEDKSKAIELVEAYFNGKDIVMKDPAHGVDDWISVRSPLYWSYLVEFCKNVDKYKIL